MKVCRSPHKILALATLTFGSTLILRAATIAITPANPTMVVGQTQQLTASGAIVPTSIAAGLWHSCVLYSDQTVRCAGNNNQRGRHAHHERRLPTAIAGHTTERQGKRSAPNRQ